jgi:hypothetical protein
VLNRICPLRTCRMDKVNSLCVLRGLMHRASVVIVVSAEYAWSGPHKCVIEPLGVYVCVLVGCFVGGEL